MMEFSSVTWASLLCFATGIPVVYSACPEGCICVQDEAAESTVSCNGLKALPSGIPVNTSKLVLKHVHLLQIPASSFQCLPSLNTLTISYSEISNIHACAFQGLENVNTIAIYRTNFGSLDAFAFQGLRNISTFEIYDSTIGVVDSFAFSYLRDIREFSLRNLTITNINPRAFYDIENVAMFTLRDSRIVTIHGGAFDRRTVSMSFVTIYGNHIYDLQRHTIDVLKETISMNSFSFFSNHVICDCRVIWMLENDTKIRLDDTLSGARCRNSNNGTNLSELTPEDIDCSDTTASHTVRLRAKPEVPSAYPNCYPRPNSELDAIDSASLTATYGASIMLTFVWLKLSYW